MTKILNFLRKSERLTAYSTRTDSDVLKRQLWFGSEEMLGRLRYNKSRKAFFQESDLEYRSNRRYVGKRWNEIPEGCTVVFQVTRKGVIEARIGKDGQKLPPPEY
jgi:hypothetical protein